MKYLILTLTVMGLMLFSHSCGDPCKDIDCSGNGICIEGNCECDPGFSGARCQTEDLCYNVNCFNGGICVSGTCICPTGWTGPTCNTPVGTPNPCENVVCFNGGYCLDGSCHCPEGWTGPDCSQEVFQTEIAFFTPDDILACPNYIAGDDREFAGHGPRQIVEIEIFIKDGNEVRARVFYHVKETTSGWTEGRYINENILLWKAGVNNNYSGYKINNIITPNEHPYLEVVDTDHAIDIFSYSSSESFVKKLLMRGDTGGKDLQYPVGGTNCISEDYAYLTIEFHQFQLEVEEL